MISPNTPRPFATSRYGALGDNVEWRTAIEHYHWDRVEEAQKLAVELGVGANAGYEGWYRLIEAEAETRSRAEVRRLTEWLELETIPEETVHAEDLAERVIEAVDGIAQRLGWTHGPRTRVSVLSAEADAPWAIGRYGYMADKYPYDKICIPQQAIDSPARLRATVAHEYAHVITLNGAEGKVPTWLDEGIAMLAEPNPDLIVRRAFADGRALWLEPDELDRAFPCRAPGWREFATDLPRLSAIGLDRRFLASQGGEARIADLLHGFANNSVLTEVKMRVTGQHPADEALREVYGMSEKEAFAEALDWIK